MTTFSNARTVPIAGALFAALILAGCASVPEAPVAGPALIETGPDFLALPGSGAPNPAWWTGFDDPELTRLVETALKASPVLRGADYSVAETEALLRLALLGKSPTLTSFASATASRPTGGSDDFDAGGTAALASAWELDVFGRLGDAIASARYDEAAGRELRRDLAVTVAVQHRTLQLALQAWKSWQAMEQSVP